jgi:hypothetical protein
MSSISDENKPRQGANRIINHAGPLTLASLDASIHGSIFRPSSRTTIKNKKKGDLYHLGWEHIPPERSYTFILQDLDFVTAEGAVTFAGLVDCLRYRCNCEVNVKIDSKGKPWAQALHLDQIVNNKWRSSFPNLPTKIGGNWALPLWRYAVKDFADCKQTADRMSRQVGQLLSNIGYHLTDEVSSATRTIFTEALLNILEHAYAGKQDRVTFEAITITPVPELDELRKLPYVTAEELAWFEENDGRLLIEIAVADIGKNVPATLGKAYCNEYPDVCSESLGLRLGQTTGQISRANLHHHISEWAFNHKSTRKTPKEFHGEMALLNWRGLHRALNTTSIFGGCLIMRSGQARAGYAFIEDEARSLSSTAIKQHEFPGTSLVLRLPITNESSRRLRAIVDAQDRTVSTAVIELERIVSTRAPVLGLEKLGPGRVRTAGIAHPFRHYKEEELKELLRLIREIPPHIITFHFFASLEPSPLMEQLPAFQEQSSLLDLGPPRLVAFHKAGENLAWKFVGIIPEAARSLVVGLETHGIAKIGNESGCRAFAERLIQVYYPFVRINGSSLELIHFNAELSNESFNTAMQLAFADWAEVTKQEWIFDHPSEIIRLPSGRLVERYVSVLKALYSDDLFAQSMGRRFSSLVKTLASEHEQLCIVTESEASYFIARILLLDHEEPIDIFITTPPESYTSRRPVIVFADAIHKGETLKLLLDNTKHCVAAVCAIDLREGIHTTITEKNTPISSLVRFPFDPLEVSSNPPETAHQVLEIDAVTHIPYEGPTLETLQIGTNDERNEFINNFSELFRLGLHRSGGRLHTVSLRNEETIRLHHKKLIEWISTIIVRALTQLPKSRRIKSIVIFTRNEAALKVMIQDVGKAVGAVVNGMEIFTAIIPVVPAGVREVFSRHAQHLFHGLQPLGPPSLFSPAPVDFLAVYLDDACVTGKTLLNFLIQVSKASSPQLPVAVLSVPMLSRFSPAEETFYKDICKSLTPSGNAGKEIPFSFHPLFRLQVRSAERLQALSLSELLNEFSSKQFGLDMRLQAYVLRVVQSIGADLSTSVRGNSDVLPFQHPFYSGQKGEPVVVSDRSLRIRHLIALLEQNVGVLSEVLVELLFACNDDDDSLLTMLVLEPDLLRIRPISKECRLDLTNLAMRALASDTTTLAMKSDALAVVALQGQPLINKASEILVAISGSSDLIDQFLVFLLTQLPSQKISSAVLDEAIQNCSSILPPDEYSYVRGCIKGFSDTLEPTGIHTRSAALQSIRKLIAGTSIHGQGHSALKAVNNWLIRPPKDRYATNAPDVRLMIAEALVVVRSAIVPGLSGLFWWAERASYDLNAALDFRAAWFQVKINLNIFETYLETLEVGAIGEYVATRIEELWVAIRDNSQTNAPDTYLSGSRTRHPHKPPVIERWAPEFFCAPFEVAVQMAARLKTTLSISSSWEQTERGLYLVVTPIPMNAISEVFRLLIEDMQKHGSENSFVIRFFLDHAENRKESLIAEFYDTTTIDDTRGTGKSQARARAIAQEHGFTVVYDDPKNPGEVYKARVIFPNFLYIKCE